MNKAADETRCSVCQLRSIFAEQARLNEALSVQARLAARVAEAHGAKAHTKEAKEMAQAIAAEILHFYGQGGI